MNIFSRKNTKEGTHKIFNLIILDESGSMQSISEATMEGLKSVFATIREGMEKFPEQEHTVSLVSFSSERIKEILWNAPVVKIPRNFERSYKPDGGTPLYDAIGFSLKKLQKMLGSLSTDGYNVLVTILTDGEENSSERFTFQQVKGLIGELESGPWTFAYIGAGLSAYEVARSLNIQNALAYNPSPDGVDVLFQLTRTANMHYLNKIAKLEDPGTNVKHGFFDLPDENPLPQ